MADLEVKDEPPIKRQKFDLGDETDKDNNVLSSTDKHSTENTIKINDETCMAGSSKDNHDNEDDKEVKTSVETDNDNLDNSDNVSEISNISGLSEEAWKPTSGAMVWIHKQIMSGVNPRPILYGLVPDESLLPDDLDDFTMWKIIINILSEPPPRKKLSHINTLQDVLQLLQNCNNIMVLTGAGVSVSCGIPDFRSRDGIYARLAVDFPDLPDPQAMFDINYFKNDPRPFFKFAKEIYPGQFEPSRSHKFISQLEQQNKLLRNYTQNIDTLEQVAGISKVIQCHGSFATATCMVCKYKVDAEVVREDIFNQVIPRCPECPSDSVLSIMKPDIVFFGESLSDEFHKQMTQDKDKCDLLIVIGSSLKVRPVALIPNSLPEDVPQILINREPLKHMHFDVELLGDCDTIVEELCKHLNWDSKSRSPVWQEISKDELKTPTPSELGDVSQDRTKIKDGESDDLNKTASNVKDSKNTGPTSEHSVKQVLQPETSASSAIDNDTVENTQNLNSTRNQTDSVSENRQDSTSVEEVKDKSDKKETSDVTISQKSETVLGNDSDISKESKMEGDSDENDLEIMRSMWKPRHGSLAKRLGERQYLFLPPSRYIFSGAEVFSDAEEDSDSDDDSHSYSSMSDEEIEAITSGENGEKKDYESESLVNGEKTELGSETSHSLNGEKQHSESHMTKEEKLFNGLIDSETTGHKNRQHGSHKHTNLSDDKHGHHTHHTSDPNHCGLDAPYLYCKVNSGMHQNFDDLENCEIEARHDKHISNGTNHEHVPANT